MIALGINEDHNATVAIVKDGRVLACASEERFAGVKNDVGYPRKAIEFVFSETKISPMDCDCVVYSSYEQDPVQLKIKRLTRFTVQDYVQEMYEYWKPLLYENFSSGYWDDLQANPYFSNPEGVYYNFDFLKNTPGAKWPEAFRRERKELVHRHLGIPTEKTIFVDHHSAHAHYAYFAAPIDRAKKTVVVTADGWGDGCNATISIAQGNIIREIHRTTMCNLARIYRWITLILGFKPNEHEYKVMGLAPYAKDYVKQPAYEIFKKTLVVDGIDFKWNKRPKDMYFYFKEQFEKGGVRFDGIAGGLQQWVEEMTVQWISNVLRKLKADSLVLSGGLSMNVKVNRAIARLPQIKEFFVAPSGGDDSLCMGAAFIVCSREDYIQPLTHVYLGSSPNYAEVEAALRKYNADGQFDILQRPTVDKIAELLVQEKVIARCAGPMEFGARALGNRSILCNPSKWGNVRKINEKIKFRDFWMPFTPTILSERANDYLVNPKRLKAPFMTIAFDSTELAKEQIVAAIHPYDFTVRPQVLEKEVNPEYHSIIKAFEKRTGIGAILNTSLNLHGKPIARTAFDAVHIFVNSGLDGLVLPETLLLKKGIL